jgi:thiamine-phosphate pyrophosphorylase
MLLYAITSRRLFPGSEPERQAALVTLAHSWARNGVDYVQIREKDLPLPDLLVLAKRIVAAVREAGSKTCVLLNGPAEVALEAGADGVHLSGDAPQGAAVASRRIFRSAGQDAIISRACHSIEEAKNACDASLIVFAPVFEKVPDQDVPGQPALSGKGLAALSEACRAADPVPVFALGGVTLANAAACVSAGAAGIAGIRLFLDTEWLRLR